MVFYQQHMTKLKRKEHQFGDTGNQRKYTDDPGRCEQGCGGFCNAYDAEGDKQDACDRQPDFRTIFHNDVDVWLLTTKISIFRYLCPEEIQ